MYGRFLGKLGERIGKYPLVLIVALFAGWAALYLFVPIEYQRDVLAPQGEGNRVYFGGSTTLSQEFVPHRGLTGIDIPLGSNLDEGSALLLHVRATIGGEDILVAPIFALQDGVAQFRFPAKMLMPNRAVWIIEAPHAPSKSFWAYREQDASAFTEGKSYSNDRMLKGNFAFTEIWNYPRAAKTISDFRASGFAFNTFEYKSLFIGLVGVLMYVFLVRFLVYEKIIITICIVVGALLHVWFGLNAPVIIDEGAYIQDVLQASGDLLPFRDFLTKGPMYLLLLWLWSFIVPNTVIAWRLFSVVAWVIGSWAFWKLLGELGMGKKSRICSVAAFSLIPAVISLTMTLLLQTASIAVVIVGLLFSLRAAKSNSWKLAAFSAALFAASFFIRVTAVIPAIIALLIYILFAVKGYKLRLIGTYIGTGVVLFALVFGGTVAAIGLEKAAVVVNMEAFLISQNRQVNQEKRSDQGEPLLRSLTIESRVLWRSGVLLLMPLVVFPLIFVNRRFIVLSAAIFSGVYVVVLGVLVTLYDTNFLLPKTLDIVSWTILMLFFGVPFITGISALLYNSPSLTKKYTDHWKVIFLAVAWLFLTALAYSHWGRFRQSYLTEFLPQLAILFGVSGSFIIATWKKIQPIWLSRAAIGIFVFLATASVYQGYALALQYPHSGTVDQKSLHKIVRLIEDNVPIDESIFTAQPIATAFSGRQIMFGYAHPGWYREARFGTISEDLRNLLFRTPEVITEYLRDEAMFVLFESRTEEIYFDGYPERNNILKNNFMLVDSVINEMSDETYALYRRR